MIANRNIVNHKLDGVVAQYASEENISLRESLDALYKSDLYLLIVNGVSDMHCRSDAYLAKELKSEIEQKKIEQSQFDKKLKEGDKDFFATLFAKELYKTLILMPRYIKENSKGDPTPFDFFRIMASSVVSSVSDFPKNIDKLLGYIGVQRSLNMEFEEIAEFVNAEPIDVSVFYEKFGRGQTAEI